MLAQGVVVYNPMHWSEMKGLKWGAREPFLPTAAMVVMIVVDSWLLGHVSTAGIVYIFYGFNLFFGLNIYPGINFIQHVRTCQIKFRLFRI